MRTNDKIIAEVFEGLSEVPYLTQGGLAYLEKVLKARLKRTKYADVIIRAVSLGTDLTGAPAPYLYEITNNGEVVGINRINWEEAAEIIGLRKIEENRTYFEFSPQDSQLEVKKHEE